MNSQAVQRNDLAGKTKLTAVNVSCGGQRTTRFLMLMHNREGKAILPSVYLDQMLRGVGRGVTYTVG